MSDRIISGVKAERQVRGEVWGVLRKAGFTDFAGNLARRYREDFVDVVWLARVDSYDGEVLPMRTDAFSVQLGVQPRVGMTEEKPSIHGCPFRTELRKRGPVDGNKAESVFWLPRDGSTVREVVEELRWGLEEQALGWFGEFPNLASVVRVLEDGGSAALGEVAGRNSYQGRRLLASWKAALGQDYRQDLERTVGELQSLWWARLPDALSCEQSGAELRGLLEGIPQEGNTTGVVPADCQLLGKNWEEGKGGIGEEALPVDARRQIWPALRKLGFTEFTAQRAYRYRDGAVEVVEVVAMDAVERKRLSYPATWLRVGVGVYWPALERLGQVRQDRRGRGQPELAECSLLMWLMPSERVPGGGPCCFAGAESAVKALTGYGAEWFRLCQDQDALTELLALEDWDLLVRFPTMRGQGGKGSVMRALLMAALYGSEPELREEWVKQAITANEEGGGGMQRWVEKVQVALAVAGVAERTRGEWG